MAKIVCDPRVMLGKPVVEGTRLTVELILEKLAAGEPVEQLLESYPHLTKQGIRAALKFALKTVRARYKPKLAKATG